MLEKYLRKEQNVAHLAWVDSCGGPCQRGFQERSAERPGAGTPALSPFHPHVMRCFAYQQHMITAVSQEPPIAAGSRRTARAAAGVLPSSADWLATIIGRPGLLGPLRQLLRPGPVVPPVRNL